MNRRPVSALFNMGQPVAPQPQPPDADSGDDPVSVPGPVNSTDAPAEKAEQEKEEKEEVAKQSKRQKKVADIGYPVSHLDDSFRAVFKNASKPTKHGNEPVSNLNVLKLSEVELEKIDGGAGLIISGNVKNTWKIAHGRRTNKHGYSPEIALYRTSVKDKWDFNMKGKVFCDCDAFNYFLAHPNYLSKNFRGTPNYAAKTYADPGPNRVRNPSMQVALCKHLVKLWHYVKQKKIENLLK